MAFVMKQRLHVGFLTFYKILRAELHTARSLPSDELRIKLPKFKNFSKDMIQKGDSVQWYAWYDGTMGSMEVKEFEGEVVDITHKDPFEIICRDKMFDFQFKKLSSNLQNMPVASYVRRAVPGVIAEIHPSIAMKRVSHLTAGKSVEWALRRLKKNNIDAFFRNGNLIVQDPSQVSPTLFPKKFKIGHNVITDNLSTREERKIKVKLRGYNPETGRLISVTHPQIGLGEEVLVDVDGNFRMNDLREQAKVVYHEIAGEGLVGDFETFGAPSVMHSDIIGFEDPDDRKRSKSVFVDKVVKIWSAEDASYRQIIYPAVVLFPGAE